MSFGDQRDRLPSSMETNSEYQQGSSSCQWFGWGQEHSEVTGMSITRIYAGTEIFNLKEVTLLYIEMTS